jgi:hypothetical protein
VTHQIKKLGEDSNGNDKEIGQWKKKESRCEKLLADALAELSVGGHKHFRNP